MGFLRRLLLLLLLFGGSRIPTGELVPKLAPKNNNNNSNNKQAATKTCNTCRLFIRLFVLCLPYPIYAESTALTWPSPGRRRAPWPAARRRRWHPHRRPQLRHIRWTHTGTRLGTRWWWICKGTKRHREWRVRHSYFSRGMSFHMIKVNIQEIMLRYKLHTMFALFGAFFPEGRAHSHSRASRCKP